MQQEFFLPPRVKESPVRTAEMKAHRSLGNGGGLFALTMASLLLLLLGFAVYYFTALLGEVLYAYTTASVLLIDVLCIVAASVLAIVAALPAFVGRVRMAGLIAMGEQPQAGEMFYYYTSPARFVRGLGLGALYLLSLGAPLILTGGALLGFFLIYEHILLVYLEEVLAITLFILSDLLCGALLFLLLYLSGTYFCATALAVGNETLSLFTALRLAFAAGKGNLGCTFRFVLRGLWHFLISVPTLGILWLCYYAHHTTVGYFHLSRALCSEE